MSQLYKGVDKLIQLGGLLAGILIVLTTFMTFYEVVSRSFFHKPTIWATELSIYAIIGSCFLGSAFAIRTYSHITVDLLINNVPSKFKVILAYASNALGLIFCLIFTYFSFHHVLNTFELGVTSASLMRVPMFLPEMFLPIGGLLMCLAFILQIIDGGEHKGGEHV